MKQVLFMGIDIGTYESKGVLMNSDAKVIATAKAPHNMEIPLPGYAEHDAEQVWWADFCQLSQELLAKTRCAPAEIAAVGCSTIAPCCLPVDRALRPLRKAILYGIDVRAEKEIHTLEALYGADNIFQKCGTAITSQSAAAKLLWIKNNEPEVYHKTFKFMTGTSYLIAKLTGNFVIDRYTAATWVPLYDIQAGDWEKDLSLFCRREQLAACRWTHEIAGTIHTDAARATGLRAGTPVITGTADAAAEALSVGVLQPGEMMMMYGSSIFMIHVVDQFLRDKRIWAGPYLFPGTYSLAAGMSTAGTLMRWYRDQFAPDIAAAAAAQNRNVYDALAEAAQEVPPGSDGLLVLPYFSGERTPINDPKAKGVIFGLTLKHTREHIYNACLEGIGYGIAQHFQIFDALHTATQKVMAVGGGTKHLKWLQIVSDICGKTQFVAQEEIGAAYGDALLAALGSGYFAGPQEIAAQIQVRREILPGPENHTRYAPYLQHYTNLYLATKELMHRIV